MRTAHEVPALSPTPQRQQQRQRQQQQETRDWQRRARAIVRLHWRRIIAEAAAFWLVTRCAYAAFTWLTAVYGAAGNGTAGPLNRVTIGPAALVERWNQWDARYFYLPIAHGGYDAHALIDSAFFPLYPLLVRGLWLLTGGTSHAHLGGWLVLCGLTVGNVGTLLAYALLALLAAVEVGEPAAVGAVLRVVTCYPLAFFLVAPYPMGWLLAGVAGALLCARLGWWRRAAVCTALATLSHPLGAVVALPVLWEWVAHMTAATRHRRVFGRRVLIVRTRLRPLAWSVLVRRLGSTWRTWLPPVLALVLAAPLALAAFLLYCQLHYHDWRAPFLAEARDFWYVRVWPWVGVADVWRNIASSGPFGSYAQLRVLTDALPLLAVGVLAVVAWGRRLLPGSFCAFCGALFLLWLCSPVIGAAFPDVALADGRHALVAVPLFLLAARWSLGGTGVWRSTIIVVGGLLLQAVLLGFYLNGGWIV